jgi:hypothetical protein
VEGGGGAARKESKNSCGGDYGPVMNSPRRVRAAPKHNSAKEMLVSSFGAAPKP